MEKYSNTEALIAYNKESSSGGFIILYNLDKESIVKRIE
jgi:hypothetical protein